ncbi:MAG TPA: DUF4175 family protein [Gemmatimonadales bacterium]|nr:DUF4175 family protein [Gemmatimonadales bacterium]
MSGPATACALERLARPLRLRQRAGSAAAALGTAALLLGGAAWLARLGVLTAPWWVLAAWAAALASIGVVAGYARRREAALALPSLARQLEDSGGWRRGAIAALLESPAPGTSGALFHLADEARAADLASRGVAAAAPLARTAGRRLAAGAGLLALGAAALGAAGPVRGAAAALWQPRRAWEMTVAPVRLRAGAEVIDRGGSVVLDVEAIGRRHAILWLRAPGEPWRPTPLALDSLGRAHHVAGPLQGDLFARATSGSRASDTISVRVRLPVFLGALIVTAHYPRYLELEDEPVPVSGDTVLLPVGTRLQTQGTATARLATAVWSGASSAETLQVQGSRFTGAFVPRASGTYRLALVTASGAPLAGDSVRIPIRLVADRAPTVEIPVPGGDTLAPLDLRLPLVVDARDDHGVRDLLIESRRINRLGGADPARRETLPLPSGSVDRAVVPFTLDLNGRGLLPGDTVRYRAVATDNSPGGQAGRSREYVLRLPTMSEVRAAQRQGGRAVAGRLDSLTEASRVLERQTEDLARERPRAEEQDGRRANELRYEDARRAEAVAARQEELVREAEALKDAIRRLEQSAEAAGLRDSAFQRQLQEIREQLDRALTPELREKLEALRQALRELKADETREALEDLVERQRRLREALEQSRELFRRAALEGDLANLTEEARDLAQEQRRWNDETARADSTRAAAAERQLATRAVSLASALEKLTPELPAARRPPLGKTADQAAEAAQEMQRAARAMLGGQRDQAARRGRRAANQLQPLGDQIAEQREELQQEWRNEVTEALDRALAEATRLADRQLGVERALSRGTPPSLTRGDQGALEEGVQRLGSQLKSMAGKNALVSPAIAEALAIAQLQMRRSREAVSSANPNTREAAERAGDAVDALNAVAYQLLRARDDVAGAASGSGLAEAMERMSQLAGQQGQLGRQSAGLLPKMGGAGMQEQLRQLGARQQALAEELEKLRGQGDIPGAGEMADEAKDLARRLEARRLDRETVLRQERLFRRMLDAGRTLQGQEEDEQKERESTTAKDDDARLPPGLRARLADDDARLRVPSWEELQRLSPEERRLVIDYFRRLSEGVR